MSGIQVSGRKYPNYRVSHKKLVFRIWHKQGIFCYHDGMTSLMKMVTFLVMSSNVRMWCETIPVAYNFSQNEHFPKEQKLKINVNLNIFIFHHIVTDFNCIYLCKTKDTIKVSQQMFTLLDIPKNVCIFINNIIT